MESTSSKSPVPFWCSIRVAITVLGFFGMILHYSQKVDLGIALVCMVNHTAIERPSSNSSAMYTDNGCSITNNTKHADGPFIWSKNIQGIILSAYFWGYILTQIPAGYLAGRYGPRFLFSGALIISGIVMMFMPFGSRIHWLVLCVLRFLVGFAHGTVWPCMTVIMARWAPKTERGKLMGFMNAGAQAGNIFTFSIGGLMCSWGLIGGWPLIFYSVGIAAFIWGILWILFFTDSPRDHRFISAEEKEFILQNTQQQLSNDNKQGFYVPWRAIMTSRACWALFIIHTCSNWGFYTFLTSTPKYMNEVLKFDITSNGLFSTLPYIVIWVIMNVTGSVADIIIRNNYLSITNTRKLFNTIGSILPAIFVIGLAFMTCQLKYIAVVLLTVGVAFNGCAFGGGFILVANDIAPAYTGIIFGISNTFATIPGIISPYVVGALTQKSPDNWRIIFFICAAIYIIGTIAFLILGSGELQPWATQSSTEPTSFENPLSRANDERGGKINNES